MDEGNPLVSKHGNRKVVGAGDVVKKELSNGQF